MDTRFFTPLDILKYFKNGELRNEFRSSNTVGVGSVADLLHITEERKKGDLDISSSGAATRLKDMMSEGTVFISEFDRDRLSTTLFEKDMDNVVTGFNTDAAKRTISPKRSLRILSLEISDDTSWWSDSVIEEMNEYHNDLG